MKKKVSLLKLFWIFFKIGLVLFGGGYAILPFLQAEIVEKEKICTVQFHPEASAGPLDTGYLFDTFIAMMGGEANA